MKKRKYRPIFLIDIAVLPRNLDPNLNRIDRGLFGLDLDALSTIIRRTFENAKRSGCCPATHRHGHRPNRTSRAKSSPQANHYRVTQNSAREGGREVQAMAEKAFHIEDTSILKRNAKIIANRMLHGAIERVKKAMTHPRTKSGSQCDT